jgi:hypothetical protein
MFVQTAQNGTWGPKAGEDGVYTLTLTGLSAQTVYFSDRPSRVVGQMQTAQFLSGLGFTPVNPPNAALVTTSSNGDADVLVIELFNPVFTENVDPSGSTLVYDARVLENFDESRLADVAGEQNAEAIPADFIGASLFIDDCPDGAGVCNNAAGEGQGPTLSTGCCFHLFDGALCHPCMTEEEGTTMCNQAYPEFCGPLGSATACNLEYTQGCGI